MQTHFAGFVQDAERHCVDCTRQFALLVADWLTEWPHQHTACYPGSHWIGFQWHELAADKQRMPTHLVTALSPLVQLRQGPATTLLKDAAHHRRTLLQYFKQ